LVAGFSGARTASIAVAGMVPGGSFPTDGAVQIGPGSGLGPFTPGATEPLVITMAARRTNLMEGPRPLGRDKRIRTSIRGHKVAF